MSKVFSGVFAVLFIISMLMAGGCSGEEKALLAQERDAANSQLQQTQAELNIACADLSAVENELAALKASFEAAQKTITELQAKSSPRYFSSPIELANWLAKDPVSEEPDAVTYGAWYAKALRVQQNAAADGFLVSVQYHYCDERHIIEYIACLTVVNGYMFMWNPETDDVELDPLWGTSKVI